MTTDQANNSRMIKDQEIDELLSKLTIEELEELQIELVDEDDPHIPASQRCRYQTNKEATGPFDRQKLLDYLHNKAINEEDWAQNKPFVKETRGKVWKPKQVEKVEEPKGELDRAYDEALAQATEEELVDLAAILGFHGMLNQSQYHHAFVSGEQAKDIPGGLQAITKCEPCKHYDYEPPNTTNIHDTTQQVKDNDPTLTSLNFNNIKDIPTTIFMQLFEALQHNTHLKQLHLANTALTDASSNLLVEALKHNKTLTHLNVESNFLSGHLITQLLASINQQQTVTEIKVANQRPEVLGVKSEMEIARLMRSNKSLLRFGVFLEVAGARLSVDQSLQRNNDAVRKERLGK